MVPNDLSWYDTIIKLLKWCHRPVGQLSLCLSCCQRFVGRNQLTCGGRTNIMSSLKKLKLDMQCNLSHGRFHNFRGENSGTCTWRKSKSLSMLAFHSYSNYKITKLWPVDHILKFLYFCTFHFWRHIVIENIFYEKNKRMQLICYAPGSYLIKVKKSDIIEIMSLWKKLKCRNTSRSAKKFFFLYW